MNKYEARPTEYNGVVFRSKTEAVFAKGVDLLGGIWHYEPEYFSSRFGWTPDFWVIFKSQSGGIISIVLELKPSPVTQTYKDELMRRFKTLKIGSEHHSALVCGSPFDRYIERTVEFIHGDIWRLQQDWIFSAWDKAVTYRFDLKPVEKRVSNEDGKKFFQALRDSIR